jgi:transcriptional regulator with GAF, ATPase, and Fis domain
MATNGESAPVESAAAVLATVARLVAETTNLTDIVSRLAPAVHAAIPFDELHVLRLDRAESFTSYISDAAGQVDVSGHRIGSADTPRAPDDDTMRSKLVCTIRQSALVRGALWLTSADDHAFTEAHQGTMDAVADLLALAIERTGMREREDLRRDRIDSLKRLLLTMAGALDIRQVFPEVSAVIRGGLPHDLLLLTAWSNDGASTRVYALAGVKVNDPTFWDPIQLSAEDREWAQRGAYVVTDARTDLPPGTALGQTCARFQIGSLLRVPLPLGSQVFGSLFFMARDLNQFSDVDIDFAVRLADHLALALSHKELADLSRRDEEARQTEARLEAQIATLTREIEARSGVRRVIGRSKEWKDVLTQATRVAQTETTVLLTGESGTGKEVVARFIHHASRRSTGPFIAINCAALPEHLLESELFGHERGAFTGAVTTKPGRIEQAAGGVLFLDEVGEMAISVQAKLLRALEEREFTRLGGNKVIRAEVRLIAATNRNLHDAIERGAFREDLYYRLGVFEITLPPLRERPGDILELADAFLAEIGQSVGRPAAGIAPDAKEQLLAYSWPGNVRELRNAIERAVILADGGLIRSQHLPVSGAGRPAAALSGPGTLPAGGMNLQELEKSLVVNALTRARYNKTRAAKLLGLTRAQLYSRIEKYGLQDPEAP